MNKNKKIKIVFMSTWPEVPDGIATFCENFVLNMPRKFHNYEISWKVIEVKRFKKLKDKLPNKVIFKINYLKKIDYLSAAQVVNNSSCEIVVIQFINGIYGNLGQDLFSFINKVRKPILVILHSVAMLPCQSNLKIKQKILKEFKKKNIPVVAMTKTAQSFLVNKLGFDKRKVYQIYHAAPKFKRINLSEKNNVLNNLGFNKNDKVVFSYGIIREDKGIEEIIRSIFIVKRKINNIKLLLCGEEQTSNKKYSKYLKGLIYKLQLSKNVKFINSFIKQDDLGRYLQVSDVFITAQHNLGLHSSGTLSYALSAGCVALSTPTLHAREFLDNAGMLIPVNNPQAIAKAVLNLFYNKRSYRIKKNRALKLGKKIIWPQIAKKYLELIIKTYNQFYQSK